MTHQDKECATSQWDFNSLKALFLNCTLKRSPEKLHTRTLIDVAEAAMARNGVRTEVIRPVDFSIPPGVFPDMREHGWDEDHWPELWKKVQAADILVIGSPIWLGEKSSECTKVIERLYGQSGQLNEQGQYIFYGKVAGCIITGNEDGIKHCSMNILYSMQHLGCVIPPQADAGWIGEAGPGPSYGENGTGLDNDFTQRNTTFMAWNLMHLARILKESNGIPAHGNQRSRWEAGCRFNHPNPEYR